MSTIDIIILAFLCVKGALSGTVGTNHSASVNNSTCPSRTINYLTHTLAQQCITSSRSGGMSTGQTDQSIIPDVASSITTVPANNSSHFSGPAGTSKPTSSDSITSTTTIPFTESRPSSHELPSSVTTRPSESVTTVTATAVTGALPVPAIASVIEEDSPLESANFLSFEEWKKQNLIKAGQSVNLGRNEKADQRDPRKRPGNVQNTLDSLGDEGEIDLDFSGLVPEGPDAINDQRQKADSGSAPGARARASSKDAGTTCKERFNYASLDCAASVLKTNPEAKSPNTVLLENKDSYMLNKCSAKNKFIILELCNDISIDTIVLANFEFFSSSFRTFRVSVSDKYPVKIDKWKSLGTFEARNTREVQPFLVENPVIWARYVRIEFLTHFGHEFYCPVSLIRVHGTTMLEEYKHDQELNVEEDDETEDIQDSDSIEDKLVPEAVDPSLLTEHFISESAEHKDRQADPEPSVAEEGDSSQPMTIVEASEPVDATCPNEFVVIREQLMSLHFHKCRLDEQQLNGNFVNSSEIINTPAIVVKSLSTSVGYNDKHSSNSATTSSEYYQPSTSLTTKTQSPKSDPSSTKQTQSASTSHESPDYKRTVLTSGMEHAKANSTSKEATRSVSTKNSPSGTQSPPAMPTMQESFFKSVQKRLQMLESNSSLSLQYIEEQSRALRDAFRKVEQRQLSKTTAFLEHLNATVLNELREFRQQYDHLWQSTVIELELQRERYQQESQAMHARLGILADELIFQRRISMLQMLLILVCLGLVLFSRGAIHNYLELPLVQSVLARSPSSKWRAASTDSRSTTPAIKRTRSAQQLGLKHGILKGHTRGASEESNHDNLTTEIYSSPSPVSFDGYSDAELVKADTKVDEDEDFDPIQIERPSTSPPVLPSVESSPTSRSIEYIDDTSIDSRLLTPLSSPERSLAPQVKIEHPTPPHGRHLTWDLPDETIPGL